ncbi:FAD-binding oxidoreductase [Microtetraspora malaysiensis]|uniref:FAD-binding oxidoreductase n=1 Tax=Microtetraspora malaysiensis TaxID=161358 RepID=A0ABW6SYK6_9ACTN
MIDRREDGEMIHVNGPVLRPGDAGYDEERTGFQLAERHRPQVIVRAAGPEDVRAAVAHAAAANLPVAVQATGHGVAVPAEEGVLISTRAMTGVRVDPAARTAWLEAGARWGQVIDAAARHGLAPLSGSSPHVGAVGYTLGGGLGLLARRYGYAADHVRAIELVTAGARRIRLTPDDELFPALLGGGGNFGVVTGMEIGLVPVTRLYGGGLHFPATADVLEAWRDWTATVPDELTSAIALAPMPDLPVVPAPLRGRHIAHVRIAYTGDPSVGERLVAPLRTAGPVLMDTLRELPYTESGSISNDPPFAHAYRSETAMLGRLDAATVFDLAGPGAAVPCVLQVRHLGGALAKPSPAVVGHRDAEYALYVLSVLDGHDPAAVEETHRRLVGALGGSGTFLNFHYGPATAEQVRAAYDADAWLRLTRLKAGHDPDNMFRFNHNIAPAR